MNRGIETVIKDGHTSAETLPQLQPLDEYNQTLRENTHPPDWVNPAPSGRYNLVVVGAGTAGLTVVQNALFFGWKRVSALTIPWCTYTDPEVAHVGIYPGEADEWRISLDTYTIDLSKVDRAILDGESNGFLKFHLRKGKDKILGATLVAQHAGDMISEVTLAMVAGIGLGRIAGVIHPYPTQAEIIKKGADAYGRSRLTPRISRLLETVLRWRR